MVRKRIVFEGFVQGVGFRWRASHAASLHGCTGWVKNEWDGSVTMEIQGSESQIDSVIKALETGHYIEIHSMKCRTIPVLDDERGFHTR